MDIFLYKMLLALHYHTMVWWGRGKMVQSQQQRLWEAQILGVRELTEQTHLLGTLGKLLYPFPGPRDPCHLEPVLSLLYWLRPSDVMVSSVSCTEMAPSWLKEPTWLAPGGILPGQSQPVLAGCWPPLTTRQAARIFKWQSQLSLYYYGRQIGQCENKSNQPKKKNKGV